MKLSWSAVDNATSYMVERDYVELAVLTDGSVTEYLDSAVAAGSTHTYRVHASNEHGTSGSLPVSAAVPFDTCRAVTKVASAFSYANLIVAEDGNLWAFGANSAGLLGNGDYETRLLPVKVMGLGNVVEAALGSYHALALDSDGQVWAWGENYEGQTGLGHGSRSTAIATRVTGMPEAVSVAAGTLFSLALAADGTVWAWGDNSYGQLGLGDEVQVMFDPVQVPGLDEVEAIFAGPHSAYAIHTDESLSVWGRNHHGQLALGDTVDRFTPQVHPTFTAVRHVASGGEFTLVQLTDETVWGAGTGEFLASGLAGDQPVPVEIGALYGAEGLAAGLNHALAILPGGAVLAWGDNDEKQVGEANVSHVDIPEAVPGLADVVFVAAGSAHSVAVLASGAIMTWGSNEVNQLGWNLPDDYFSFVPIELPADVAELAASSHSLALLSDGSVWAWGYGDYGQIGHGLAQNAYSPVQIEFPAGVTIVKVAAGTAYSLALDSIGRIWSWGEGGSGQLGHGDLDSQLQPVLVSTVGAIFTDISAGGRHALAIDNLGGVWAWGANNLGQLGLGDTVDVNVPTRIVTLANAARVSAGFTHSGVVLTNGELWTFGYRINGALGDGGPTIGIQTSPVKSLIADVADVTASLNHTFAVLNDGSVSSWGYNYWDSLGLGHDGDEPLPATVPGLTDIVSVSSRRYTGLAVDATGNLYGWGEADDGQLGTDQLVQVGTPRLLTPPVAGAAAAVAAGSYYSLVNIDGQVYGTGSDLNGGLGQGQLAQRGTPEVVGGMPPAATQ